MTLENPFAGLCLSCGDDVATVDVRAEFTRRTVEVKRGEERVIRIYDPKQNAFLAGVLNYGLRPSFQAQQDDVVRDFGHNVDHIIHYDISERSSHPLRTRSYTAIHGKCGESLGIPRRRESADIIVRNQEELEARFPYLAEVSGLKEVEEDFFVRLRRFSSLRQEPFEALKAFEILETV